MKQTKIIVFFLNKYETLYMNMKHHRVRGLILQVIHVVQVYICRLQLYFKYDLLSHAYAAK